MEKLLATFERTLSASDTKHNIPFNFAVPAGTAQLIIRLSFEPHKVDGFLNMLTLSVFDPHGWRGAGHRHGAAHEVIIAEHFATHGYRAGTLPAGEWSVVVDTHMVMVGAPCALRLDVLASDVQPSIEKRQAASSRSAARPAPLAPRWYRGDLHAHSLHSDARWDIPDLLAWARAQQLDFCTLSDHNTISGLAEMDAACSDDLLTMGGMELTTFWGHALALGTRAWIDWRVGNGRTMTQIAADVEARGGTFIIAHPMSVGDPHCTGCQWRYAEMMPGTARVVEVWNGPWSGDSNNEDALAHVYEWLNAGHRFALSAGSDQHGSAEEVRATYGFAVVYAAERSEQAILRAVRDGHLYLSAGPTLEFTARTGDTQAMMGDELALAANQRATLTARWHGVPERATLSLIVQGEAREKTVIAGDGEQAWQAGADDRWCLLTLRAASGEMLALTNPIFLDGRASSH